MKKARGSLDFELPSINGAGPVAVEPGKVTLIHVWATFAAPCKRSLPALQALASRHGEAGLRVIGLSMDDGEDKEAVVAFVKQLGITFPVAVDHQAAVATRLEPPTMPSTIIVDRQGTIHVRMAGFGEGDEARLEEVVKGLL